MNRSITLAATVGAALFAMPALAAGPLLTPAELQAMQADSDLVIIDMRIGQPDGSMVYADGHIPGSIHAPMDTQNWRANVDGVAVMLPEPAAFEGYMRTLGIDDDETVVLVYDGYGTTPCDFSTAARAYWSLKSMGHDDVAILNGGVRAWLEAGYELSTEATLPDAPGTFTAEFTDAYLVTDAEIETGINEPMTIVDARGPSYYNGEAKHGAARVAGTVPSAVNLPAARFLQDGRMVDVDAIRAAFGSVGVEADDEVAFLCNAGYHAAVEWFAAYELAGMTNARMYDGSMIEWTADPARPVQVVVPAE